jgi:hypothetical protein
MRENFANAAKTFRQMYDLALINHFQTRGEQLSNGQKEGCREEGSCQDTIDIKFPNDPRIVKVHIR